jgi:NTP pyrophosphatase (non-canonical NTP hydrolase)
MTEKIDLQELVDSSSKNAEDKGFHDDGILLREILSRLTEHGSVLSVEDGFIDIPNGFWERIYAAYKGNRLMLIVGELVETHEEIRRGMPDVYEGENGKPEGVAIELADVQIRIGDFAGEFEHDLPAAIETKATFNKTRAQRHGGKLF